jgi:parallel beta-helix repeat protein
MPSVSFSRINTFLLMLIVLMAGSIMAILATRASGGPLDPPGAPASTDGVLRPGTAISALPFTIAQPGNYYLSRSLTMASSGDGITITASNVTLDLGGFTVDGGGVGRDGIATSGPSGQNSVVIRNGGANNWTRTGFNLNGADSSLESVRANHDTNGITMDGTIDGCTANNDSGIGVSAFFTTVTNCQASGDGTGFHVFAGSLSHCEADSNGTGINAEGATVEDCSITQSTGDGVLVSGLANIHDDEIETSGANGIRVNGVGAMIDDNTIEGSGGSILASGIFAAANNARISHNVVSRTNGEGIAVDGSFGTIDDNSTFQNSDIGIKIQGSKNTVVRNSSTGNGPSLPTTNYSIGAGNNPGPIDAANSASNPWSNTQ